MPTLLRCLVAFVLQPPGSKRFMQPNRCTLDGAPASDIIFAHETNREGSFGLLCDDKLLGSFFSLVLLPLLVTESGRAIGGMQYLSFVSSLLVRPAGCTSAQVGWVPVWLALKKKIRTQPHGREIAGQGEAEGSKMDVAG